MNTILSKLLLPLCLILFLPQVISACVCPNMFSPACASFSNADAVFIGTIRKITKPEKTNDFYSITAKMTVEDAFKGNQRKEVEVDFPISECGFEKVEVGQRYFVYAESNASTERLEVPTCSRTVLLEKAKFDVEYANNIRPGKERFSITGRVFWLSGNEKAKVVVKNGNEERESFIDSYGEYKIESFGKSSKFIVQLLFPFEMQSAFQLDECPQSAGIKTCFEYEVNRKKDGCSYLELPLVNLNN